MSQVLFPVLRYRDAHAAIAWLESALGCERTAVHEDDAGLVAHAELAFRGACIMLSSVIEHGEFAKLAPPPGNAAVYVVVDDPDALHDRIAASGGGEIVMGLRDLDYGSRDFSARDPEGNLWSFGTYAP